MSQKGFKILRKHWGKVDTGNKDTAYSRANARAASVNTGRVTAVQPDPTLLWTRVDGRREDAAAADEVDLLVDSPPPYRKQAPPKPLSKNPKLRTLSLSSDTERPSFARDSGHEAPDGQTGSDDTRVNTPNGGTERINVGLGQTPDTLLSNENGPSEAKSRLADMHKSLDSGITPVIRKRAAKTTQRAVTPDGVKSDDVTIRSSESSEALNNSVRGSRSSVVTSVHDLATIEEAASNRVTSTQMEDQAFSEELYKKFLVEFSPTATSSGDREADKQKALWLIREAHSDSRVRVLRIEAQYQQAIAEIRQQKFALKKQEMHFREKIASLERDLKNKASLDQERNETEIAKFGEEVEGLKCKHEKAINEKNVAIAEKDEMIKQKEAYLVSCGEQQQQVLGRMQESITKTDNERKSQVAQHRKELHRIELIHCETLDKLKREHEHTKMQHTDELHRISAKYQREISYIQEKNGKVMAEADEAHRMELSRLCASADNDKKEMETTHTYALRSLEQKNNDQHSSLVEDHARQLDHLQQKHEDKVSQLKAELEATVDGAEKLAARSTQERSEIEAEHDEKVEHLRRTQAAEKAQLENAVHSAKEDTVQEIQKLTAAHEQQIAQLKQSIGGSKVELVQRQRARESKLAEIHNQQMQQLQEQLHDFNEALLTKDEESYQGQLFSTSCLPRKTDDEIRKQFGDIQSKVEMLSKLEWKTHQECWTPEVFQRIHDKAAQRVVKVAIIEDLIWTQLFHFVFSSPFRIFGEDGKTLEDDWNKDRRRGNPESSSLFDWPEPSIKTELWRAFTVKGCRDILRQQLSAHDSRASLKKCFKQSLDSLNETLKSELESIAELTTTETELIAKLCRQAANTWLQFAMCQSRIVISLTGEEVKSTAEKVAQVQRGSLGLTRLPRVSRYGTAAGVELTKCTTVEGCDGDCRTIP